MADSTKAVFLSYASQDAAAALRICEALRAAGVEVWFDQSELVGGDAWDQMIRKHIKECTLLIPIISAATQARTEGYFRLEWRLADQRTHLMAKGRPFLLPVVIDDTRDADAHVPDSFTEVQWTRLRGGETPPAFVARVKKLLSGEVDAGRVHRPVSAEITGREPRATPEKRKPIWLWVALAVVVAVPAYLIFKPRRPPPDLAKVMADAQILAANASKLSGLNTGGAPGSSADVAPLLARVDVIASKTDVFRSELDTATSLLEQAARLDPDNARVWAEWALVDWRYGIEYFDRSPARFDAARRHVAQAMSLDPNLPAGRLAQALVMTLLNEDAATQAAAAKILESVLPDLPNDGRVPLELGWHTFDREHPEVALGWFDRTAKIPGQAGRAHFGRAVTFMMLGSLDRTETELDQALAAERAPSFLLWKAYLLTIWNGDVVGARRVLQEIPPQMWVEDMPAITRYFVQLNGRDFDGALATLRAVPHDYLESVAFSGPSSYFKGDLLARAGKPAAAQLEWRSALAVVERRLATEPNDRTLMQFKALLLSCLGDDASADQVWKAELELYGDKGGDGVEQLLRMKLLPRDQAFDWVAQEVAKSLPIATAARLRSDPSYDAIRSDPRFPALLAQAEADPRLSPTAKAQPAVTAPAMDEQTVLANKSAPADKSVAVLAFANLSDDKNNEYFSDGISEELLTALQKIPGLHVAARTSSFYFKGKDVTAQEIGAKLGVANLIEGSVQKSGSRVKVSVHLSRAATGEELWSESYTRELKDVFALQEELTLAIVGELRGQLAGGDNAAVKAAVKGGTSDAEALQQYLQGRYYANRHAEKPTNEAIAYFQRAVDRDPTFALAWAALAETHLWLCEFSDVLDHNGFELHLSVARTAMGRALALDPNLPEGLLARSLIESNVDYDWKAAGATLQLAHSLAPADPAIVTALGNLAGAVGDSKLAIVRLRESVALDPVNPVARSYLAFAYVTTGQYAEAQAEYDRLAELNATAPWAYAGAGLSYVLQGKFEQGAAVAQKDAAEWARLLIVAIARFGQKRMPEADAALAQLTAKFADVAAYQIAEVYGYRGDADQAFAWLERARQQRDGGILGITEDPLLAKIRPDPRYEKFVRKLGLAPDQLR